MAAAAAGFIPCGCAAANQRQTPTAHRAATTTPTPISSDLRSLLFSCLECLRNHLPWREVPLAVVFGPVHITVRTVAASHDNSRVVVTLLGPNLDTKVCPCIASRIAGTRSVERHALMT